MLHHTWFRGSSTADQAVICLDASCGRNAAWSMQRFCTHGGPHLTRTGELKRSLSPQKACHQPIFLSIPSCSGNCLQRQSCAIAQSSWAHCPQTRDQACRSAISICHMTSWDACARVWMFSTMVSQSKIGRVLAAEFTSGMPDFTRKCLFPRAICRLACPSR